MSCTFSTQVRCKCVEAEVVVKMAVFCFRSPPFPAFEIYVRVRYEMLKSQSVI